MKSLFIQVLSGVLMYGVSLTLGASAQQTNAPAQPTQQVPTTQSDQARPDQSNPGQSNSGQSNPSQSNPGAPTGEPRIAPGSVIPVQLTKTIDAKKLKTGDEIEAKITQDLKSGKGDVVLPKDTKVMGHVTEAQARNKEQKESEVGIAFDHAVMKNGGDMKLPMSIQAIIAPPSSNAGNSDAGGSASQAPSPQGGGMPSSGGGRSAWMGGGTPSQASAPPVATGQSSTKTEATNQPITANTQGVVGISSLRLSAAANATEGSIVSSEKGNVKLESGTLMLLRVNQ
jgi:hypothetical protein